MAGERNHTRLAFAAEIWLCGLQSRFDYNVPVTLVLNNCMSGVVCNER